MAYFVQLLPDCPCPFPQVTNTLLVVARHRLAIADIMGIEDTLINAQATASTRATLAASTLVTAGIEAAWVISTVAAQVILVVGSLVEGSRCLGTDCSGTDSAYCDINYQRP